MKYFQNFRAGVEIYRQGEAGGTMYIIESGSVEIYRVIDGWRQDIAVLQTDDFFGEMAIVANRPHQATAVAREDTRLLLIDEGTLTAMLKDRSEIAARMIKTLVERLEQANRKLSNLLRYHEEHVRETAPEAPADPDLEFNTLWTSISDVIIDKDYATALDYLSQAEKLRPEDPRLARYRRKLEDLSMMDEDV